MATRPTPEPNVIVAAYAPGDDLDQLIRFAANMAINFIAEVRLVCVVDPQADVRLATAFSELAQAAHTLQRASTRWVGVSWQLVTHDDEREAFATLSRSAGLILVTQDCARRHWEHHNPAAPKRGFLDATACPVLVCPTAAEYAHPDAVTLAVDTHISAAGARFVLALARRFSARLDIHHRRGDATADPMASLSALFKDVAYNYHPAEPGSTSLVEFVLAAAERGKPTWLLLAGMRSDWRKSWFAGSVAQFVSVLAECPVVVLPSEAPRLDWMLSSRVLAEAEFT